MSESDLRDGLIPPPQRLSLEAGGLPVRGETLSLAVPSGPEHAACRAVLADTLRAAGATVRTRAVSQRTGCRFTLGQGGDAPPLPAGQDSPDAYTLVIRPGGVTAQAASPSGLLYAAQTLRQLARLSGDGRWPCLTITDYPAFPMRGIYIEGGQERFGRIVTKDYLRAQIRRLAGFKMNTLVIECYNLFPYPSFPACADAGTLSERDCREVFAEARRWHVTLVPSLQTLAQASELVWNCEAGAPYREVTAPGLTCPSNPALYPFIKGLYRDLLTRFDATPLLGIGCSEIDMQWQSRYCPRCRARIERGETVRDLLLGHAERCIRAVEELAQERGRPARPMMWGDEFYMYGPGKDWVGMEHIPKRTVMGFWKYWPDYAGIGGLMARGYDVLGISAIYNHCFYLADLSPEDPPKSWPSMEQTGILNIDGMARDADAARRQYPGRRFLGVATASFSKHRLRAFDTLWYGFALNGGCTWNPPERPLPQYQPAFTRAFVRHYYDARTGEAVETLAAAYERLDRRKSRLERANQTLHDVVGVYDTQEAGYVGNSLMGAWQRCAGLLQPDGAPQEPLRAILEDARETVREAGAVLAALEAARAQVGCREEWADLRLAADRIRSHAERQILMAETQAALARVESLPPAEARRLLAGEAARWQAHRAEIAAIARHLRRLDTQGDPCGEQALLRDITAICRHLECLVKPGPKAPAGKTDEMLLEEPFHTLDPARWEILGEPRVAAGHLETRAPGGWGRFCGLLSRQAFALDARRPLIVEFTLTPQEMGVDSPLLASATQPTDISFCFALAGSGNRLIVHTQSAAPLRGEWLDRRAGWHPRASSPEVTPGKTYRVRAEITRGAWRVTVRQPGERPWDLPFWDTGAIPMDSLAAARLMFADVEPENHTAVTRWGAIRIYQAAQAAAAPGPERAKGR